MGGAIGLSEHVLMCTLSYVTANLYPNGKTTRTEVALKTLNTRNNQTHTINIHAHICMYNMHMQILTCKHAHANINMQTCTCKY